MCTSWYGRTTRRRFAKYNSLVFSLSCFCAARRSRAPFITRRPHTVRVLLDLTSSLSSAAAFSLSVCMLMWYTDDLYNLRKWMKICQTRFAKTGDYARSTWGQIIFKHTLYKTRIYILRIVVTLLPQRWINLVYTGIIKPKKSWEDQHIK